MCSIKKKSGKVSLLTILLITTTLSILLIVLFNMFFVYKIAVNEEISHNTTDSLLSILLSDGLSIIAIAISVWLGLNIVNALRAEQVDAIQKKINLLTEGSNQISRNYYNQISIYISSLLFNLSQCDDQINLFLYKELDTIRKKFDDDLIIDTVIDLLARCNEIELMFLQTYKNHYSLHFNKVDYFYESINNYLKETEEKLKDANINESSIFIFFNTYLELRKAEFSFYRGYVLKSENIKKLNVDDQKYIIRNFNNTINCYLSVFIVSNDSIKYKSEELENPLQLYIYNTLAESYSKIVEVTNCIGDSNLNETSNRLTKPKKFIKKRFKKFDDSYVFLTRENYVEKTKDYFKIVEDIMTKNNLENSTYYRNYGYALIRCDEKKAYNKNSKAKEYFQKSIDIAIKNNKIDSKSVRGWLKFYHDYMKEQLYVNEENTQLKNLNDDIEFYIKYAEEALSYAELANHFDDLIIYSKLMYCFIQRDLYLLYKEKGNEKKNAAYSDFERTYCILKNYKLNDNNYYKQIENFKVSHDNLSKM